MIFALGCAVAMAAAAPASFAQEWKAAEQAAREVHQVRVIYADLDVSTPEGASALVGRLHNAALVACGASEFSIPEYRRSVERSDCFRDSMGRAVAEVGAPAVTRLYHRTLGQG
jgi:UrcA family protein